MAIFCETHAYTGKSHSRSRSSGASQLRHVLLHNGLASARASEGAPLQIYELAVKQDGAIWLSSKSTGEPKLLQVNKQIRDEASAVYFKINDFCIFVDGGLNQPLDFARLAERFRLADIRCLVLEFEFGDSLLRNLSYLDEGGVPYWAEFDHDEDVAWSIPEAEELAHDETDKCVSLAYQLLELGLPKASLHVSSPMMTGEDVDGVARKALISMHETMDRMLDQGESSVDQALKYNGSLDELFRNWGGNEDDHGAETEERQGDDELIRSLREFMAETSL